MSDQAALGAVEHAPLCHVQRGQDWFCTCGVGDPPECRNCGRSIVPDSRTSTGWTHGPEDPPLWKNWQGVRCPGRLTGAQPTETAPTMVQPQPGGDQDE